VHRNETIGKATRPQIKPLTAVDFTQRMQDLNDAHARVEDALVTAQDAQFATEDVDNAKNNLGDLALALDNASFAVDATAFQDPDGTDILGMIDHTQHRLLALAASFSSVRTQASQNLLDVQELTSADVLAYDDVVQTLKFEEWTRTQHTECTKIIGNAKAAETDARARAARRPRGIYRVKSGDTLDRISMKWYGNPDSARFIRDANNLDSIVLIPGVDLIIPDTNR